MVEKSAVLNWLQNEYQQWTEFLDQISPSRMDQPGVNGDWSMKDMIAHLSAWNIWHVSRLRAAQRGEPEPAPPWPGQLQAEDEINAWIFESNRKRPLSKILEETRLVNQQLFEIIETCPDSTRIELVEPFYYLIWIGDKRFEVGEFYTHFHDDHEPDVRAWLERGETHHAQS